ncbi:MAG: hypothetical protein ACK4G4_10980 [Thermus sp.]|uniref:Outer membrane lipoprotein-sorting protein n=1 Tax=Thermus tengchongensis TaxID=1214928 RepID=A0A4Y9F7C9_9DEIN|nr:hypothetical protein [Thermus tengchongensis]TFU24953.1 hypothetical protein E0687_13185 [Thermus tengchongensis]
MKRSLALILALFSPLALTQSPKEAVESALKAAFGDWRGKTYQGLDRVVYFTPEGQETQVLRIRTYLDLGGCRLRLEIAPEGEKAPATLVYTRERQFLRLPDGRETPLDDRLFLELIFAWQTGFTGAAFGYDEVASLGKVTLPDGSEAEAYRVVRRTHACLPKGVLEAKPYEGKVYLREGKVVGEGYFSPIVGAETLFLYRDFREEGGARHPLKGEGYVRQGDRWVLFSRGETLEAQVDLPLEEALFR